MTWDPQHQSFPLTMCSVHLYPRERKKADYFIHPVFYGEWAIYKMLTCFSRIISSSVWIYVSASWAKQRQPVPPLQHWCLVYPLLKRINPQWPSRTTSLEEIVQTHVTRHSFIISTPIIWLLVKGHQHILNLVKPTRISGWKDSIHVYLSLFQS